MALLLGGLAFVSNAAARASDQPAFVRLEVHAELRQGRQSIEPPQLSVSAPPELRPVAAQIAQFDLTRLVSVMRLVGLPHAGPTIPVLLVPESSQHAASTPPWIAGYADAASSSIVIFPSRSPSYPHDSIEQVLHHEVTHILIARAAGHAHVPRWFHEGLALAAERTWGFEDRTRLALAVTGVRRSVGELEGDFHGSEGQAARAYAISGALVRELLSRHGFDMPARTLSRLAAGDDFEEAFVSATGQSVADAEELFWRDSWWHHVVPFVTSSLVIWIGITALALYAMRQRARRRATLRERWESEDADADYAD